MKLTETPHPEDEGIEPCQKCAISFVVLYVILSATFLWFVVLL